MNEPYSELAAAGLAADVRPAQAADAVDGVLPGAVVSPATRQAVAETLAWASGRRLSVVIRGGGTKLAWGRSPAALDLLLDMRRLDRLLVHARGDLTVTVDAGIRLRALNDALRTAGQWLPLDPPSYDGATIGGLLATNDSGPHRHRFGTPRDLVIGIELATMDGRLVKAGGRVVKNVAGYDLSKLMSGSFGALAAIAGATFKLAPLPSASRTLLVEGLDAAALAEAVQRLAATQLEPVAVEFHARSGGQPGEARCLIRFASVPAAVEAQVSAACAHLEGFRLRVLGGGEEVALWQAHDRGLWSAPGTIVRASWDPAETGAVGRALASIGRRVPVEAAGRALVGAGHVRIGGSATQQAAAIGELRDGGTFGHVTIVRGSTELKRLTDVWPAIPNRPLLASIKRVLDPTGALGAGRGPF